MDRQPPTPEAFVQSQLEDDRAIGDWNIVGMLGKYCILHTDAIDRIESLHQRTDDDEEEEERKKPTVSEIEATSRRMMMATKLYYDRHEELLALGGGKQTSANLEGLLALARNKPLGAYKLHELDESAYANLLFLFHYFPESCMRMLPEADLGTDDAPPSARAVRFNAFVLDHYKFSAWLHREAAEFLQPLFQTFFPNTVPNLPLLEDDDMAIVTVAGQLYHAMLGTHNGTLDALRARCSPEQLEGISEQLRDGRGFRALSARYNIATKTLWSTRVVLLYVEDAMQGAGQRPDHLSKRKAARRANQQSERNRKIQARNERNRERNIQRQAKRKPRKDRATWEKEKDASHRAELRQKGIQYLHQGNAPALAVSKKKTPLNFELRVNKK